MTAPDTVYRELARLATILQQLSLATASMAASAVNDATYVDLVGSLTVVIGTLEQRKQQLARELNHLQPVLDVAVRLREETRRMVREVR